MKTKCKSLIGLHSRNNKTLSMAETYTNAQKKTVNAYQRYFNSCGVVYTISFAIC